MKIKTIIIDDEPIARVGLKGYVNRIEHLEHIGSYPNPAAAASKTEGLKVDLMLLDIRMPKINGLDYLRTFKNPPLTIITTAYPEFALEGFELDVMDYLVKPVSFPKFQKAVNKVTDYLNLKAAQTVQPGYFFVKSGGKIERIYFEDILFIEALQNYVTIHTVSGKIIAYTTMKNVYSSLPEDKFLRVHKSYIVAVRYVDAITGSKIMIKDNEVKVSRELRKDIFEKLKDKTLKR